MKLETFSVIDVVDCSIIDVPVVAPFVDVIDGTLVDDLSFDTEVVDSPAIDILVFFLVDEEVVTWAVVVIIVVSEVDTMTGELTYEVETVDVFSDVEEDVKIVDVNFTVEVKLETNSEIDVVDWSIIDEPVVASFVDVINGTLDDDLSMDVEVADAPAIDILVIFSLVGKYVVSWALVVIIVVSVVNIMTEEVTYDVDTIDGLSVVEEDVKLVDGNFTLEVKIETVSVIDVVNCAIIDVLVVAEFVDVINRCEVDVLSTDTKVVLVKVESVSVIDVVNCLIIEISFVDVISWSKVDVLSIDAEIVE